MRKKNDYEYECMLGCKKKNQKTISFFYLGGEEFLEMGIVASKREPIDVFYFNVSDYM